jgi:hypothetical protein
MDIPCGRMDEPPWAMDILRRATISLRRQMDVLCEATDILCVWMFPPVCAMDALGREMDLIFE